MAAAKSARNRAEICGMVAERAEKGMWRRNNADHTKCTSSTLVLGGPRCQKPMWWLSRLLQSPNP